MLTPVITLYYCAPRLLQLTANDLILHTEEVAQTFEGTSAVVMGIRPESQLVKRKWRPGELHETRHSLVWITCPLLLSYFYLQSTTGNQTRHSYAYTKSTLRFLRAYYDCIYQHTINHECFACANASFMR